MVLNSTKKQLEAIHMLLEVIMKEKTADIPSSLVKDLMQPIFKKIDDRVKAEVNGKKGWNLTLTPLQAKSYYTFFEGMQLDPQWQWQSIIIGQHLIEIEKEYA
jgi:hypothetical protein